MLLSIIRSVVVFNMSVDMFVINNLMYALNTESVCLNFGALRWPNTVFARAFADAIQRAHKDCKKQI